jgi:hypothetical protein
VLSGFTGHFSRRLDDIDVDAVVTFGQELLEQQPRTRAELYDLLGARCPAGTRTPWRPP